MREDKRRRGRKRKGREGKGPQANSHSVSCTSVRVYAHTYTLTCVKRDHKNKARSGHSAAGYPREEKGMLHAPQSNALPQGTHSQPGGPPAPPCVERPVQRGHEAEGLGGEDFLLAPGHRPEDTYTHGGQHGRKFNVLVGKW